MGTKQSLRSGATSLAEKNLVAAVVMDNPGEITTSQILGLAKGLRRSPTAVRTMIEEARARFQGNAGRYVDIHLAAVENALSQLDNETAMKGAQWAIERSSGEGVRVIDPKVAAGETGGKGPRIMLGINIGNVDTQKTNIPIEAVVLETPDE